MRCKLEDKIDHNKAKDKFRDTLFFCRLFEKQGIGMNQLGVICGACCIRCQMVTEALDGLIMSKTISYEQLKHDPKCFFEYLSEELREYVDLMAICLKGRIYGFFQTWLAVKELHS